MRKRGAGGPAATFGDHEGHSVARHDHSGQDRESRTAENWCSGRHLCVSCATRSLPRGVWFTGPKCPRPKAAQ